jgi:spermidine/putrescine transport system permease protein
MYAPVFVLIAFSFTESTLIGNWSGFSLELYKKLFENEQVMTALKNTILIALASAVVSTILGTLGAVGVYYCKKRIRKGVEFIGQVPILNPEIVTALSLTILFVFLGVRFNFITLLIGHVVLTIPFVVLSITPKLKQMDPNVYEAALDLGAKPSMALRKVVLPEIIPGVLSGFVLAITLSLDDYIITAFTRNNSFQTISTYVYGVTAKKGALPPTLRALTTIIFLFTLILLIFINIRSKKKEVKR